MIPESPNRNGQILNIVAVTSVTIVLGLSLLGNYGPSLMTNDKCFSWLGCNIGFFGYDALIHFISGTMDVALIIWLMTKFPSFSLFHNRFWKNLLTVVALVALIAVLWEILEFSHDYFRIALRASQKEIFSFQEFLETKQIALKRKNFLLLRPNARNFSD